MVTHRQIRALSCLYGDRLIRGLENVSSMATDDRTSARVYLSQAEKTDWEAHADELDMSLAEFIRTMVNAGRREFDLEPVEIGSHTTNPWGETLEKEVQELLEERGPATVADIHDDLDDVPDDRIDEHLQTLQDHGRIEHIGPGKGYALTADE